MGVFIAIVALGAHGLHRGLNMLGVIDLQLMVYREQYRGCFITIVAFGSHGLHRGLLMLGVVGISFINHPCGYAGVLACIPSASLQW